MKASILVFLSSRAKWMKIGLLLRETALRAQFSIMHALRGNRQAVGPNSQLASHATQESSGRAQRYEWQYTSQLKLPVALLGGAGKRFRQDEVQKDGCLQTEYDYQCAVFTQACIYSNGASHVSAFDAEGRRIKKFSSVKFGKAVPAACQLRRKRHLEGRTLSLYGNVEHATGNVAHWMIDGISRLFLAQKFFQMAQIDHVLVPRLKYDFQLDSLLALGISKEKIVEIAPLECMSCEQLVLTTAPRGYSSSSTPGWLIDAFRKQLMPSANNKTGGKKIYVSRRDAASRKFINEEAIVACLEDLGFQAVEMSSYNFRQKIELFANAEVVVGLTGAGMTNVMFCQRGTTVIELFPESFIQYLYASVCSYLDLDYHHLVFSNNTLLSNLNQHYGELYLDPPVLLNKIIANVG